MQWCLSRFALGQPSGSSELSRRWAALLLFWEGKGREGAEFATRLGDEMVSQIAENMYQY